MPRCCNPHIVIFCSLRAAVVVRKPTTKICGCSKADFSPEKVSRAPSSLCSIFSQSEMWSATNLGHLFAPVDSSFASFGHPFIGMSSRNGMVMSGMQSLNTLFIVFTMCAIELVPTCGRVCRIRVYNGRIHIVPLDSPSLGYLCK